MWGRGWWGKAKKTRSQDMEAVDVGGEMNVPITVTCEAMVAGDGHLGS